MSILMSSIFYYQQTNHTLTDHSLGTTGQKHLSCLSIFTLILIIVAHRFLTTYLSPPELKSGTSYSTVHRVVCPIASFTTISF
ncbi:hypothetical protein O181_036456 [Austropuccinia psidii MF-1]|uniref:Uncharacterized protein n=1 Tax=Austropuccinia psidii MF-1 TaxID=1389203 RepID=A0A9Q3D4G4_9BASI|nr:hypothetical protein [Austropuccinia psidii MF-1]